MRRSLMDTKSTFFVTRILAPNTVIVQTEQFLLVLRFVGHSVPVDGKCNTPDHALHQRAAVYTVELRSIQKRVQALRTYAADELVW